MATNIQPLVFNKDNQLLNKEVKLEKQYKNTKFLLYLL